MQCHLYKTGHSHRVMRDYAIKSYNNLVGNKKSSTKEHHSFICEILNYLQNLGPILIMNAFCYL